MTVRVAGGDKTDLLQGLRETRQYRLRQCSTVGCHGSKESFHIWVQSAISKYLLSGTWRRTRRVIQGEAESRRESSGVRVGW